MPFNRWVAQFLRSLLPELVAMPPALLGVWLLVPTGLAPPRLAAGLAVAAMALLAFSAASRRRVGRSLHAARLALDHIDQGVVLIDPAGRVPVANRPAAAFLVAAGQTPDRAPLGEGRHEQVRADGSALEICQRLLPDGTLLRTMTDITRCRTAERQARFLAEHDPLTGLINRRMFLDLLQQPPPPGSEQAVLFLDLGCLRGINESLAHHVGDPLLVQVAERLRQSMRPGDILARLGDDDFAVLQVEGASVANALALARRLRRRLDVPYQVQGMRLTVACTIGVALAPGQAIGAGLLQCAELALAGARQADGGVCLYQPEMMARLQSRQFLEQALRELMEGDPGSQMRLVYQPVVDAQGGAVVGCEALLRWRHPLRGDISPAEFIPIAEATGLILPLGAWVLEQACREAAGWPAPIRVAVNLSPAQFFASDLLAEIDAILLRSGLPTNRLQLEVTEGLMIDDAPRAIATLEALQARGVGLSLDDFGTGYASLARLRQFPFDTVKLDRSYIAAMEQDAKTAHVVAAVLGLAEALQMRTVAEGVETEQQFDMLRRMGCDLVQGYLTGRPQDAGALRARLSAEAGATILPFPARDVRLAAPA